MMDFVVVDFDGLWSPHQSLLVLKKNQTFILTLRLKPNSHNKANFILSIIFRL